MDERGDELAAQDEFVASRIDPIVRRVLASSDPHDAYWAAGDIPNALQGDTQLPNWGSMYVAWSELADVFETGRTPRPTRTPHCEVPRWNGWNVRCQRASSSSNPGLSGPRPQSRRCTRATAISGPSENSRDDRTGCPWTAGGRVGVRLGDGLPIFEAALRDCFGARPEGGQVEAVWNRVERAINRLEVDLAKGDGGPLASGSVTFLRVVNGRVEAGYLQNPEDRDIVETAPVEEVMALLEAWRRAMFRRVAVEATKPRALEPPAPRRSAAGGFRAWLLGK